MFGIMQYSNSLRSHVVRTFNEAGYETIEISGPQMVLTMKLTTFAWNVWDGRRPVEVCLSLVISSLCIRGTLLGPGQMATEQTNCSYSINRCAPRLCVRLFNFHTLLVLTMLVGFTFLDFSLDHI